MLLDAIRLSDGAEVEVWTDKRVKFGAIFREGGERYRRLVNRIAPPGLGDDPGFHRKGPITMWTEPFAGRGTVRAPYYDRNGLAVFTSQKQVRKYVAQSKDTSRPVEWIK